MLSFPSLAFCEGHVWLILLVLHAVRRRPLQRTLQACQDKNRPYVLPLGLAGGQETGQGVGETCPTGGGRIDGGFLLHMRGVTIFPAPCLILHQVLIAAGTSRECTPLSISLRWVSNPVPVLLHPLPAHAIEQQEMKTFRGMHLVVLQSCWNWNGFINSFAFHRASCPGHVFCTLSCLWTRCPILLLTSHTCLSLPCSCGPRVKGMFILTDFYYIVFFV